MTLLTTFGLDIMGFNVKPRSSSSSFMRRLVAVLQRVEWLKRKKPELGMIKQGPWKRSDLERVSSRHVDNHLDYSFILSVIDTLNEFGSKNGVLIQINHVLRGDQDGYNQLISRHHVGAAVDFTTVPQRLDLREAAVAYLKDVGYRPNYVHHYDRFTHVDFALKNNIADVLSRIKS